ncbi:MAG: hypothetical protein ABFR47_04900 [Verrucomicrobiota bacterium]
MSFWGNSKKGKEGFTITEAALASTILLSAVALIHTGVSAHLQTLRLSALLQEAQDLAFRETWNRFSVPFNNMKDITFPTPATSRMGTNGLVRIVIIPDSVDPNRRVTIGCQVWAPPLAGYGEKYRRPANSSDGRHRLAECRLERFRGD